MMRNAIVAVLCLLGSSATAQNWEIVYKVLDFTLADLEINSVSCYDSKVFVAASFNGELKYPGKTITSSGDEGIFFQIDTSGTVDWYARFLDGEALDIQGNSAGEAVLGGHFSDGGKLVLMDGTEEDFGELGFEVSEAYAIILNEDGGLVDSYTTKHDMSLDFIDLEVGDDNSVYAAYNSFGSSEDDVLIRRLPLSGHKQWTKSISSFGTFFINGISVSETGNLAVVGHFSEGLIVETDKSEVLLSADGWKDDGFMCVYDAETGSYGHVTSAETEEDFRAVEVMASGDYIDVVWDFEGTIKNIGRHCRF